MNNTGGLFDLGGHSRLARFWSTNKPWLTWVGGGGLLGLWVYSGMPMICH